MNVDFAAILNEAFMHNPQKSWQGVLDTKVPELCPTPIIGFNDDGFPCHPANCPDCPTVARLLAIAAAVMQCDRNLNRDGRWDIINEQGDSHLYAWSLLDHLRAVAQ